MEFFQIILIVATFLCSLVAGFLLAFAVVVMPGLKSLDDRAFVRAFQVMDGVIQNNQPVFILVWAGSVVALLIAVVLGLGQLAGFDLLLLIAAAVAYVAGVQAPTAMINIPLNNSIQKVNVEAIDESARQAARSSFEPRWTQWNSIRTVIASLASALLIVLVLRL